MSLSCFADDARTLIETRGEDLRPFLQGIVTSDIHRLTAERALYAALLTPQGKYLADFVMFAEGDAVYLDTAASQAEDLVRRLSLYRLRRKIDITRTDTETACLFGEGAGAALGLPAERGACGRWETFSAAVDPRDARLGIRVWGAGAATRLTAFGARPVTRADWDTHRIRLEVPEGGSDLLPERIFPLEAGFERLDGIDFHKGCYVGQEVTARMRHKAVLHRGIRKVRIEGTPPPAGTPIEADGKPAGTLLSCSGDIGWGLAHLNMARAGSAAELTAAGHRLVLTGE